MKKILVSIILYFFLSVNSFGHLEHYSKLKYLEYDLFRNNELIGSHKYEFLRVNENLTVKSVVNFKITKLGIDLYKYFAESEENYTKNNFTSFNSTRCRTNYFANCVMVIINLCFRVQYNFSYFNIFNSYCSVFSSSLFGSRTV